MYDQKGMELQVDFSERLQMKSIHDLRTRGKVLSFALLLVITSSPLLAQTCFTSEDMDAATRAALQSAATRYSDMVMRGDVASLKQNAIPAVAGNFGSIEGTIKDNQANLAGAKATPRPVFMLKAEGAAPLPRAEFLCGICGKDGQTAK